jgi:hypothetical protein
LAAKATADRIAESNHNERTLGVKGGAIPADGAPAWGCVKTFWGATTQKVIVTGGDFDVPRDAPVMLGWISHS